MNYTEMVVALGNRCTAECRMCCFSADAHGNEQLDLPIIYAFLETAEKVEEITTIHFSGGEVFLYYESLLELIKLSKKINKKTTIITNGFWAIDERIVYQRLNELKEAGLSAIGVSYDEFHKEFIDLENIRNIIRIAKKVGVKVSIQATIIEGSKNGKWLDDLGSDLVDVIVDFIACDNVGRALNKLDENVYIKNTDSKGCICRKGGAFCILFDGTVWPCCSPVVCHTDLCIGNIYNGLNSVQDAIDKLQKNPILKILRNRGFDYYSDLIRKENLFDIPEKVVSSCELCKMFFSHEQLKKLTPYIYKKIMNDDECIKYEL